MTGRKKGGYMIENFKFLVDAFLVYTEKNPIWYLYFFSVIYIIFAGKKEGRCIFIYPLLFQILTVFNPVFLGIFIEKFGFGNRYLRFFWMLIFYAVIGYAGVDFLFRLRKNWMKIIAFFLILCIITGVGKPVFKGEDIPEYKMAENPQFTSNEILKLSHLYHSEGLEVPHILFDGWQLLNYRSYDPDITSELTRERFEYMMNHDEESFLKGKASENIKKIFQVYSYGDFRIVPQEFRNALASEKIDYVTAAKNDPLNDYLEMAGLLPLGESERYMVWKVNK